MGNGVHGVLLNQKFRSSSHESMNTLEDFDCTVAEHFPHFRPVSRLANTRISGHFDRKLNKIEQ